MSSSRSCPAPHTCSRSRTRSNALWSWQADGSENTSRSRHGSLAKTSLSITIEHDRLPFQPQDRMERRSCERVLQHGSRMPEHKCGTVNECRRKVLQLDPALSAPSEKLNFLRRYVLGAYDCRRAVVMRHIFVDDQLVVPE